MDKSRSVNPVNFMSNMLYACRILYKTKLPFIVVMNKTDAKSRKLQEQIEHLQKNMGAVAMEMTPQTEEADVLATVTSSSTVGTRMRRGWTATWMTSITAVSGEFYKIKSPCIPNKSIINKSYVGSKDLFQKYY
ncbi:GPN-loop GTPase QQT2 isoform X2 [Oncorhynchus tshawytscha]|nr:GPN-loop GTPase QQT2 isoform X2 [Oncorhynchus tshawytscha]XP_042181271.1 GPN-loop GTPase QQT2 isoform X2 [Oncorhynchus tshawytscha]